MSEAMCAASAALFEERIDPGKASSAVLAAAVHLALLAVLIFGVRWQNHPPDAVSVELWEPPSPAPVVEAPRPAPRVEPAPPPPAPVVKPEPVVPKPDIVLKAPPPKPVPKVEPKPAPKPQAVKPKVDEARKRLQEELAREQNSLAIEQEQIKDQLTRDAISIDSRALEAWKAKIIAKIRGNIIPPPDLQGNPETIFIVVQIPSGVVISRKLGKSSGNKAYDEAVERAILKASPLPPPDRPELFDRGRELTLKFRPKD